MARYMSVGDLEDRLGAPFVDDDLPKVVAFLDDAEAIIDFPVGVLDTRITRGTTTPDRIKVAIFNMIKRLLINPSGLRGETYPEYAYVVDPAASSSWLTLTRDDRALLGIRRTARSIAMGDTALTRPFRCPPYVGFGAGRSYDETPWIANDTTDLD